MNIEKMEIIREKLIALMGQEKFEEKIIKIADILNDLEYHDVELPTEEVVKIIKEILEDKAKKLHRMQWQVERALEVRLRKSKRKGIGKFTWKSTAEKIWLLDQIRDLKEKGYKWKEIKKKLQVDARSLIYNIIEGKTYATEIERKKAKEIWENYIDHTAVLIENRKKTRKYKEKNLWTFETVEL